MKSTCWLCVVLASALFVMTAASEPSNYSGRWKINLDRCSFEEIYPERIPETVLDITLEGLVLTIRKTVSTSSGTSVVERRFTTDGKECLNAGQSLSDLKSVCRLENGRIIISGEAEGVGASQRAGSGESPSLEYFRYGLAEEYSLSADGRELTLRQTLSFPDRKRSVRLLFERN